MALSLYSTLLAVCFLGTALAVPKCGHQVASQPVSAPLEAADSNLRYPEDETCAEEASNDLADVDQVIPDSTKGQAVTPVALFPSAEWKRIGYLDMTKASQQCFDAWTIYNSPRRSCGRKGQAGGCDSVLLSASGYNYSTVCGRFRGYQIGTPDGFRNGKSIEGPYVDGISLTYGPAGARKHLFTYAAGWSELKTKYNPCPCAGGPKAPTFVGTSYHCESGNPGPSYSYGIMYSEDPLWDGQQCGGDEGSCCSEPTYFCTQLPARISSDIEVRICLDSPYDNEDVAIDYLEVFVK